MQAAEQLMSEQELRALPPVIDVPTAARALGVGRSAAYEMIRTDAWPTPVLRLGRLIRVPSAPLLDLLGLSRDS
jgi:predicted DNA-binding transcriptional regulator AlpA